MGVLKRILKSDAVRNAACWLGAQYVRLVWATGRWTIDGDSLPRQMWAEDKPFILAFWHGHLLMMPKCWNLAKPMHMLISQHRDGQIIAQVIGHFGLGTAAGSSTRGGSAALRQMLKALKAGEYVGITPDGPRGPRMRATAGIVNIARLSGVPILPCAYSTHRRKQLGSWDRFQVALPFSRGLIRWGAPITVARDADEAALEQARQQVEQAMIALAQGVERDMGHLPTEPAPPGPPPEKRSKTGTTP
ncbi:lysophospholipid acyltransferase family protein [Insolitispirillum peregrinum]|uniref:lysophospholipid acyltransferase family protein n=1 Tax=Insolitispirillum peregrinum TaxID=80876 RepID=UPI0036117290